MLHRDETGKREATPAGCAPEAGGELKRRKKRMWDIDGSGNEVPNDPPAAAGAHAQIQIQQKAMMTAVMQQQVCHESDSDSDAQICLFPSRATRLPRLYSGSAHAPRTAQLEANSAQQHAVSE